MWGFRAPATSTAVVGADLEQLPEVYLCSGPVPQYADPTRGTQRQHAHHAEVAAAKQELQTQRHINEAHMHRVGGPAVWGV